MGTRADFYVGKNELEWLGSIAWDGYPSGIREVIEVASEEVYRAAIEEHMMTRDDWTSPDMGWPWPWNNSFTSDCGYTFFDGRVWMERNDVWNPASFLIDPVEVDFPDMSDRKNLAMGTKRDSIMIITG